MARNIASPNCWVEKEFLVRWADQCRVQALLGAFAVLRETSGLSLTAMPLAPLYERGVTALAIAYRSS